MYVYSRTEKISKYIGENESQASHSWRKASEGRKMGRLELATRCWAGIRGVWTHGSEKYRKIDEYVCAHTYFLALSVEMDSKQFDLSRNSKPRPLFLVLEYCFQVKWTQSPWGEWGGQGKYKMSLNNTAVPESTDVLKGLWGHVKGHGSQLDAAPNGRVWGTGTTKWIVTVMDYNLCNQYWWVQTKRRIEYTNEGGKRKNSWLTWSFNEHHLNVAFYYFCSILSWK